MQFCFKFLFVWLFIGFINKCEIILKIIFWIGKNVILYIFKKLKDGGQYVWIFVFYVFVCVDDENEVGKQS